LTKLNNLATVFLWNFHHGVCAKKETARYSSVLTEKTNADPMPSSAIALLGYHRTEMPAENQCRSHSEFKLGHWRVGNLDRLIIYFTREGEGITVRTGGWISGMQRQYISYI
jgi:hypothetical protein